MDSLEDVMEDLLDRRKHRGGGEYQGAYLEWPDHSQRPAFPSDVQLVFCHNCGTANDSVHTCCPTCSIRLVDTGPRTCPDCFSPVPQTARFCPHCGQEIQNVRGASGV